jgi:hypothetical protein
MTAHPVTTKAELLVDIAHTWGALNAALERLSAEQMTTIHDAQGWTVKDHLIHLAAWERSTVFFLHGQRRHLGLGVGESVYESGSDDIINAAIYQQSKDLPLSETLDQFRETHQELLASLQPLTDDDLSQRYRHYLPDEPGEGAEPTAMQVIYGNSAGHFSDHLAWIEALVGGAGAL